MRLRDGREVVTDAGIPGGRYNVYDCPGPDGRGAHIDHRSTANPMGRYVEAEFHHGLLSLDVDEGVTPMFVTCPDHDRTAASRGYRVDRPGVFLPVRMVWRRATRGELKRERRESGAGGHYASGGLAREWVPAAPADAEAS